MLWHPLAGAAPSHPPSLYLGKVLREVLCVLDLGLLLLLGGQYRGVERQYFLFLSFKFPTYFSKLQDLLTLLGGMKRWVRGNKRGPCSTPGNASMLALCWCSRVPSTTPAFHTLTTNNSLLLLIGHEENCSRHTEEETLQSTGGLRKPGIQSALERVVRVGWG